MRSWLGLTMGWLGRGGRSSWARCGDRPLAALLVPVETLLLLFRFPSLVGVVLAVGFGIAPK